MDNETKTKEVLEKKTNTKSEPIIKKTEAKAPVKNATGKKVPITRPGKNRVEIPKKMTGVKESPTKKTKKRQEVKEIDDEIVKDLEKEKKKIVVEKKGLRKKRKGKVFYLVFSLVFYLSAFFYINNILYDNKDFLESALFAFAALFVVFVLIQFNVHMIIVNFFWLPFKYLYEEMKLEHKKKVGRPLKSTKKFTYKKYKSTVTLIVYIMIIIIFVGAVLRNGIVDKDKVLVIVTQSSVTLFILLIILCSWQYLFNILPRILNKSIDAKNGFILTLSVAVMVIFLLFNIFGITNLKEVMIFILIIGFIALLGVNLNMIVGEINIFQNLRQKHSSTVTRAVFLIFFSFHLYVILYASVVTYSIYQWEPDAYNFSYTSYDTVVLDEVYDYAGDPISEVYYYNELFSLVPLVDVYNSNGEIITDFYTEDDSPVKKVYNSVGIEILQFYNQIGHPYEKYNTLDSNGEELIDFYFRDDSLVGEMLEEREHTYGDFLYYSVVTVSTLGYGDITPSTDYNIALAWGGFLSFYGFSFFALSIGFVSNIAIEGITTSRKD